MNKRKYLPPIPKQARVNYHLSQESKNNNLRPFSSKNPHPYQTNLLMAFQNQTKIEQNYINTVLLKRMQNLSEEKKQIEKDHKNQLRKYDLNRSYQKEREKELIELNSKIIQNQIALKRKSLNDSFQIKKSLLDTVNNEVQKYRFYLSCEKENSRKVQDYYKMQLRDQIIFKLKSKVEKHEEYSNRSRIKNKLLLNDYLNTYNKNSPYY